MSVVIPEDVKESLKTIGFTDYETSIYLSLILQGTMDARELSKASGVPYSRIYSILTQLEKEKIWIDKEEKCRPSKYFANSPDEALLIMKKQNNIKFNEYSKKILQTLNPIYQSHDIPKKITLYIYRGRNKCINKMISLIKLAKTSIYLVFTDYILLSFLYEEVKKARARGVINIRLLIEESALNDQIFKNLLIKYQTICEIKSRNQIFGSSIIIEEGEKAFIMLSHKLFNNVSYFGVDMDHIAFGPVSSSYFNYLYQTVKIVDLT